MTIPALLVTSLTLGTFNDRIPESWVTCLGRHGHFKEHQVSSVIQMASSKLSAQGDDWNAADIPRKERNKKVL